jgi:hypothetical protein
MWAIITMSKTQFLCMLFLLAWAVTAHAASIECPETGKGAVPLSPAEARLFSSGSDVDRANEIGNLVVSLKAKNPGISYGGLINAAIAAYCPIVANDSSLDAPQKLNRLRKFDAIVREQLSSEIKPQASSILAQVDISPEVYRALREKADKAGQTPSQFMAALLTKAAGEAKGQ